MTNEEADYLVGLEKVLKDPNHVIDLKERKNTLELIAPADAECAFRLDIRANTKIVYKVSMHHMEANTCEALMRLDFKGRHKNPEEIIATVPGYLEEYAGRFFDIDEPHLHVYVEGYKNLAWAMPIADIGFSPQEINSIDDLEELIHSFAGQINLSSKLAIQSALL